jgi:heat shock protein HslJ
MKQFVLLLAALAAVLVIAACSPTGGQEPIAAEPTAETEATAPTIPAEEPAIMGDNALQGVRWVLVSYVNAAGETVTALVDSEVTAEFGPDGQVAGSGGCNRYFASYTVDGGNLAIGQAGSTMMACEPVEIMEQEAQFLAALGSAATWQVEGDVLTISNAAGAPIIAMQASQPASLTGTTWTATGYNNGREAVVSLVADTTITATFAEDGSLNGSAGCNNFMTSYTLDGANITIQPAATTRKLCPGEGVMEQETQFLTALTTAATWSISGNELELRTADGALVAHFVAQPAQ